MASYVFVNGVLGDKINANTRIVKVDSLSSKQGKNNNLVDVPCINWNHLANCEMNKLNEGSKVSIKGRIEKDEHLGLYILVENLEYLSPPISM